MTQHNAVLRMLHCSLPRLEVMAKGQKARHCRLYGETSKMHLVRLLNVRELNSCNNNMHARPILDYCSCV